MNKENRNLVNLDDNELDNIVGGAFNQNFIAQYNLKTLTGKRGAVYGSQETRFNLSNT